MKEDYQIIADWISDEAEDTCFEVEFLLLELEKLGWKVSDNYEDVLAICRDKQKTKEM